MRTSAGGERAFSSALEAAGLTVEEARYACGAELMRSDVPMAPWTRDLNAWFDIFPWKMCAHALFADGDAESSPTSVLYEPLWGYVEAQCTARLEDVMERFVEGAFREWRTSFFQTMREFCQVLLFKELTARAGRMQATAWREWIKERVAPDVHSGAFWYDMAMKYPVLARQVTLILMNTVRHLCEVARSLCANRESLYAQFFSGRSASRIALVCASTSDSHNGGRNVHIIRFEDGERLVFKPRELRMDRAWAAYLRDLCAFAGIEPLYAPDTLDVDGFGYCEYIEAKALARVDDAALYFKRAGFLMGALYLLFGGDMHAENLIAHGDMPVLIDVETVAQPNAYNPFLVGGPPKGSALRTHFLPFLRSGKGIYLGFSALCADDPGMQNLPYVDGFRFSGHEYPEAVERGFDLAYTTFLANAEKIASCKGIIDAFHDAPARLIYRSTARYALFLQLLSGRACLAHALEYERVLMRLTREFGDMWRERAHARAAESVLGEEMEALKRRDIPHFEVVIDEAALERIRRNMRSLDAQNFKEQIATIRLLLRRVCARDGEDAPLVRSDVHNDVGLTGAIERCANDLMRALNPEGERFSLVSERGRTMYQLGAPSPTMLEGTLGMCLALCAVNAVEPSVYAAAAVRAFFHHIEERLDGESLNLSRMELGLAEGAGGFLLSLALMARMGEPVDELLTRALSFISQIKLRPWQMSAYAESLLYGEPGLALALAKLPLRFETLELRTFKETVRVRLVQVIEHCLSCKGSERRGLRDGLDGAILALEAISGPRDAQTLAFAGALEIPSSDATPDVIAGWALLQCAVGNAFCLQACSTSPVQNDTLAYGNAALLSAMTERRLTFRLGEPDVRECNLADTVASALQENRFLPTLDPTFFRAGLFYGEAGALYALARRARPDRVPSIYFLDGGSDVENA